jgi:hypothetical protein
MSDSPLKFLVPSPSEPASQKWRKRDTCGGAGVPNASQVLLPSTVEGSLYGVRRSPLTLHDRLPMCRLAFNDGGIILTKLLS